MNKRIEEMKRKGNMTQFYMLHYIKKYIALKHYPPTIREIADGIGVKSTSTIHRHMHKLKMAGKIDFEESKPRTLHLKEGA